MPEAVPGLPRGVSAAGVCVGGRVRPGGSAALPLVPVRKAWARL